MSNSKMFWWIGGVVVLAAFILIIFTNNKNAVSNTVATIEDPSSLPGLQMSTSTPWQVEVDNLKARLTAINLPALSQEGSVLHIHQHLDIYIHGKSVAIPPGIGINEADHFISPIHVHDDTGVIHVESPSVQDFTLGQFFDIWGVKFTANCIGGYCAGSDAALHVYLNGALYTGDPRILVLKAHQELVVAFGTEAELPKTIPASYTFEGGE